MKKFVLRIPNLPIRWQIRQKLSPLRVVLAWIDDGAWWPPHCVRKQWDDHNSGVRMERRGVFIGKVYVGVEGVPVSAR